MNQLSRSKGAKSPRSAFARVDSRVLFTDIEGSTSLPSRFPALRTSVVSRGESDDR